MKILSLIMLQAAITTPNPPTPLTDIQMRDIGCVAIIALVADQQRKGISGFDRYGNLSESGAVFTFNVGQRIIEESGQSHEVIGFAIQESAREQLPLLSAERSDDLSVRMNDCLPALDQSIATSDESKETPITANDYRVCAAMIAVLKDRDEAAIENAALLFENLSWRYQQEKYGKTRNASTFARADILKEKSLQNSIVKFDDAIIDRCKKIGS